jgi:hypothetical protein
VFPRQCIAPLSAHASVPWKLHKIIATIEGDDFKGLSDLTIHEEAVLVTGRQVIKFTQAAVWGTKAMGSLIKK